MAHTATTSTATTPVAASGPGALAGFEFRCEACAEVARFSIESLAAEHARAHVSYMLRREGRPSKLEQIAAAQAMRANGASLFEIATTLGVTKEWLRAYAL